MATYAIGDVQGCYDPLQALLATFKYDPKHDQLWFTGDLVNRGPQSLKVLAFVRDCGESAVTVLGNHDLHCCAVACGARAVSKRDTFQDVLASSACDELMGWLRERPLFYRSEAHHAVISHAGIFPGWGVAEACRYALEIQGVLRSSDYKDFLIHMYGNMPNLWSQDLEGWDRYRFISNAFTRMRHIDGGGGLILEEADDGSLRYPWFRAPGRKAVDERVLFGHWAALGGKTEMANVYALDTGCCWGHSLTALRLDDGQIFRVNCHSSQ